jgi:hypothetical protein
VEKRHVHALSLRKQTRDVHHAHLAEVFVRGARRVPNARSFPLKQSEDGITWGPVFGATAPPQDDSRPKGVSLSLLSPW